jgi:hypothetical protein
LKLVPKSQNFIITMLIHHSILSRPRVKKLILRLVPSPFKDGCPRHCHVVKMALNPLECPTRAVGWCEHAADAAHSLASVRHCSWQVTVD